MDQLNTIPESHSLNVGLNPEGQVIVKKDEIIHAQETTYVDMDGKEIPGLKIIEQINEVEERSGVPFVLDITEVASLAQRAKAVTSVADPAFYTIKKEMQQKRKYVTEYFYDARVEFNKLSKGVIEIEKMVLAEFKPEEDRLIALDKADKEQKLKEERLSALPAKKERMDQYNFEYSDEYLLEMTDADFELMFAKRVAEKAEADRVIAEAKLAEERAAFEAEKAELARQKAEADAVEAARIEERRKSDEALKLQKAEAERKEKEAEERRKAEDEERRLRLERDERERKEKAEREEQERLDRIAREKAEREAAQKAMEEEEAKQKATKKWQTFLTENNYDPETDTVIGSKLYRLVATYTE